MGWSKPGIGLGRIETVICQTLLAVFVTLLFVQIVARQVFGYSFTWIEELSVVIFVWFAYFGASEATRQSAHNRVSFHLSRLPRVKARWIEALGDLVWLGFNAVFIWQSVKFIGLLKPFVKLQTLGWQMRWVYVALPIAFAAMSLRIIQVNWFKLVHGIDPHDPDRAEIDGYMHNPARDQES